MAKSDVYESALLEAVLNNDIIAPFTVLGAAASGLRASTTNGDLQLWLTLDGTVPDDTWGSAQIAPVAPTYANWGLLGPLAVARDPLSKEWTVSAGAATNANDLTFPQVEAGFAGSETYGYAFLMDSQSTSVLYWAALTAPITVSAGSTPQIDAGGLDITED